MEVSQHNFEIVYFFIHFWSFRFTYLEGLLSGISSENVGLLPLCNDVTCLLPSVPIPVTALECCQYSPASPFVVLVGSLCWCPASHTGLNSSPPSRGFQQVCLLLVCRVCLACSHFNPWVSSLLQTWKIKASISLNIFCPIPTLLITSMLECLKCQIGCQGLISFFLCNPEISIWQRSWTAVWLTSHTSALPGISPLLAIGHLKLVVACRWSWSVWQEVSNGRWALNSVLLTSCFALSKANFPHHHFPIFKLRRLYA